MTQTLLQTKLHIPPQRPQLVNRSRLIERLNQGFRRGAKLSLIAAPAGFGKTTLVAEWGRQLSAAAPSTAVTGSPAFCWLSLDEHDDDLSRFLTYFVAALRTAVPGLSQPVMDALQVSDMPPITELLTTLLNDIAALPEPLVLVLDDYHVVDDSSIDQALAFLVGHQPPTLHLVIATRADPALPLSRLRARQDLTELRTSDLRFSEDEAADFLKAITGADFTAEQVAALDGRTEGWIAGLQLAALSMADGQDSDTFVAGFSGSHRFILDYLADEVLATRPPGTRDFLLRTSILDRLCGPLCDAVLANGEQRTAQAMGTTNGLPSQQVLAQLDAANLFLIPLDNERRWYRYHHLFAELLRQRLRQQMPEKVAALHARASHWFAANDLIDEAFNHALAADDLGRAVRLVQENAFAFFGQGEIATVGYWLNAFSTETIQRDSTLCVIQAWLHYFALQPEAAESYLDLAQDAADGELAPAMMGRIAMLRGWVARTRGVTEKAIGWHRQAFTYMPENHSAYGLNTLFLASALQADGQIDLAIQHYHTGIDRSLSNGSLSAAMGSTYGLANLFVLQGHLRRATEVLEEKLEWARQRALHDSPALGLIHVGLGRVYYELNAFDRAISHLTAAIETNPFATKTMTPATMVLGWIHYWLGDRTRMQEAMATVSREIQHWNIAGDIADIEYEQVRLWLKSGDEASVAKWLARHPDDPRQAAVISLARARILLAKGRAEPDHAHLMQAKAIVDELVETAAILKQNGRLIELFSLQALIYAAQREEEAAIETLSRALMLAEPEGYMRRVVDEGRSMARLLQTALEREVTPNYARRLLSLFPDQETRKSDIDAGKESKSTATIVVLVESLSSREREVLELVADGFTNREIAQKLFLSTGTVKVHTRNIYGKLGVNSRTQAVAKARSMDIL